MKKVTCLVLPTNESRLSEEVLRQKTRLDRAFADIVITFPGGSPVESIVRHNLRDYFRNIEVTRTNENSFNVTFYLQRDAGNFWKDLVVGILNSIEESGDSTSIVSVADDTD